MSVRIEDVARSIGVSPKTVSRILNNEPNVSSAMRKRVLAGLKALNYQPNMSARRLAGRRSFLITMLYDNPSPHYVMEVQNGVLQACDACHYSMVVRKLPLNAPDFMRRVEMLVMQPRPDGIVLTPPLCDHAPLVNLLRSQHMPFASISPKVRHRGVGVAMDDRSAARAMVQHLVALGHRRIAHISGPPSHGASSWRLRGYRDGLREAGLPFDRAWVVDGKFSFDSGVSGARHLFSLQQRPTAVFAGNDDTAAGVLWAAAECGLKIPDDVSVCGFDDTPLSRQVWPALTTVSQPSDDMGRIATEELLHVIEYKKQKDKIAVVPFVLRRRQSTGPVGGF